MKEVFRLQNAEELLLAEERYLPKGRASMRAIILAASRGNELGDVTAGIPKAMVPIGGTPLLHKLVAQFRTAGFLRSLWCVAMRPKQCAHPTLNL